MINAGLNLVFVIGFKMSVAGVALATIISQAVSAVLVTRSLMLMDGPTRLHLNRLSIKPHIMRMIIQIACLRAFRAACSRSPMSSSSLR